MWSGKKHLEDVPVAILACPRTRSVLPAQPSLHSRQAIVLAKHGEMGCLAFIAPLDGDPGHAAGSYGGSE